MTLCITIYRDVFRADEWAYLLSVADTGRNVQAWLADRYPVRGTDLRLERLLDEDNAA